MSVRYHIMIKYDTIYFNNNVVIDVQLYMLLYAYKKLNVNKRPQGKKNQIINCSM